MPSPFVFQPLTDSIAVAGRNTCRRNLLSSAKDMDTCPSTAWLRYSLDATVQATGLSSPPNPLACAKPIRYRIIQGEDAPDPNLGSYRKSWAHSVFVEVQSLVHVAACRTTPVGVIGYPNSAMISEQQHSVDFL